MRFLALLALVSSPTLFAAPVVYGTGWGLNGAALTAGEVDPHYTVTPGYGGGPAAAYDASPAGVKFLDWWGGTKQSQWITPDAYTAQSYPDTTFDYTTTFDLKNPGAFYIKGQIAADDSVKIFLNGVQVGQDNNTDAWLKKDPFLINSNFVAGPNTLTFEVQNVDGATGLDVALDPVNTPEPASIGLLGLGLIAPLLGARLFAKIRRANAVAA